jgi:hypothetical protein
MVQIGDIGTRGGGLVSIHANQQRYITALSHREMLRVRIRIEREKVILL